MSADAPAARPIELALRAEARRVFGGRAELAEIEPGMWAVSVPNDGTHIKAGGQMLLDILKAMPEVARG